MTNFFGRKFQHRNSHSLRWDPFFFFFSFLSFFGIQVGRGGGGGSRSNRDYRRLGDIAESHLLPSHWMDECFCVHDALLSGLLKKSLLEEASEYWSQFCSMWNLHINSPLFKTYHTYLDFLDHRKAVLTKIS